MLGHVDGWPKLLLRMEGAIALLGGILFYYKLGFDWYLYLLYFFVPDISFVGYVWGSRVGAILYNFAHSYLIPGILLGMGALIDSQILLMSGVIWISHIGFDRALGFGLKYAQGFKHTHLGLIGKISPE